MNINTPAERRPHLGQCIGDRWKHRAPHGAPGAPGHSKNAGWITLFKQQESSPSQLDG